MTKTLKLHIGQHKTGTSFLQSVLALSTGALADSGILYPTDKSTARAATGGVSFGNWPSFRALLATPDLMDQMAEPVVLFSSEGFCENLPEPDFLDQFQRLVADDRLGAVDVLLYIRDPVAYAISYAQQLTKRAGMGLSGTEYPVGGSAFRDFGGERRQVDRQRRLESAERGLAVIAGL